MSHQNGVTFDIVMHFYSLLFLSRKLVGFLCSISVDTLMRIVIMLLLYHLVIISLDSLRLQMMNILLLPFVFYCHWFCFAYSDGDFCTFPSSYYFKLYQYCYADLEYVFVLLHLFFSCFTSSNFGLLFLYLVFVSVYDAFLE